MAMTLKEIKEDVLRKLYIEQPSTAPESILSDVLIAVNQAFELLNLAGNPFWRESTSTEAFSAIIPSITLTGALRVNKVTNAAGRNLMRAADEEKVKFAHEVYSGTLTAGSDYEALVYHVDASMDGTTKGEVLTLHVGPQPLASQNLTVHFLSLFVPFTKDQMESEFEPVSLPYKYVETLLLPIARYLASRSHWFSNEEAIGRLREDYEMAMGVLQAANPEISFAEAMPKPERASA